MAGGRIDTDGRSKKKGIHAISGLPLPRAPVIEGFYTSPQQEKDAAGKRQSLDVLRHHMYTIRPVTSLEFSRLRMHTRLSTSEPFAPHAHKVCPFSHRFFHWASQCAFDESASQTKARTSCSDEFHLQYPTQAILFRYKQKLGDSRTDGGPDFCA